MVKLLLVGVGGFFGTTARYGISGLFARSAFPTGTLAVNVLGCLAMGNLMGLVVDKPERIETLLAHLDEMVTEGLVTIENVQTIAYRHSPADS